MVDSKVFPRQFAGTRLTDSVGGSIPENAALFRCEASLGILSRKQAADDSTQNLLAFASLRYVVRHLRDGHKILSVKLLIWPCALGLALQFTNFVNSGPERIQQIPSQSVQAAIIHYHSFLFNLSDQHCKRVKISHVPKSGRLELW